MSHRIIPARDRDDTPTDPGAVGVIHEIGRLTDTEAHEQYQLLADAPAPIHRLAAVRLAALALKIGALR